MFLKSTRRDLFKNGPGIYLGNPVLGKFLQRCEVDRVGAKYQIWDLHHPTLGGAKHLALHNLFAEMLDFHENLLFRVLPFNFVVF